MKGMHTYLALVFTFILGVKDGSLALWQLPHPDPIAILPCRVEMLPDTDRKTLEAGIYIEDEPARHRALEDYLS